MPIAVLDFARPFHTPTMPLEISRGSPIWERVRDSSDHTGTTFEAHLEGTASLLRAWRQRGPVELAGRYHAVYGNPRGRGGICSADGSELAAQIGGEAEALVRVWSRIERTSLARALASYAAGEDPLTLMAVAGEPIGVSRQQFVDLAHLQAANALDIASRTRQPLPRSVRDLSPVLCVEAVAQMNQYRPRAVPARLWAALRKRA